MGGDSRNLATGGQASCHFKWPNAKLLAVQARVVFYTLCFPASVAIAPHWSALATPPGAWTPAGLTPPSLSSAVSLHADTSLGPDFQDLPGKIVGCLRGAGGLEKEVREVGCYS